MKLTFTLLLLTTLAGCAVTPVAGQQAASSPVSSSCRPSDAALLAPPAGSPSKAPFSYRLAEAAGAAGELDTIRVDGAAMQVQAGILIVSLDAEPVEQEGPEGKVPGILAHRTLIEPVLRDFKLEVVEQMRIPLLPQAAGASPAPVMRWKVQPNFLVRVLDAESAPLSELQSDGAALGATGEWTFERRATAGLVARWFSLLRRKDCYKIRSVGLNSLATPG